MRAFACQAGLGAAQTREMIDRLLDEGVDVNAYSAPMLARQLSQPALYVHSTDEHVVAIADAGAASAAWRGAPAARGRTRASTTAFGSGGGGGCHRARR